MTTASRPGEPAGAAASLDAEAVDRALLDALVAQRRLSAADAERLLELRLRQGQRLGRLLISAGAISQEGLRDQLADVLGIGTWEAPTRAEEMDAEAARLLPAAFMRFNGVMPVEAVEGALTLAMSMPPDEALVESVRQATGREVRTVAATQRDVGAGLDLALAGLEGGGEEDGPDVALLDAETLRDLASEAPVVQFLGAALERAVALGASDIHLERSERAARLRFRVDGELVDVEPPPLAHYPGLVSRIKIMATLDVGERRLPQDGRVRVTTSGREIDLRVSVLPSLHGEDVVLRILDKGSITLDLDELGLLPEHREGFRRLFRRPEGMVLLTGPTGSGKTTTLYSGLREIARPNVKAITVEDPVEYNVPGVNQIQVRSEIGLDFARCLRSILRHDPDVIMVGEIRDRETAAMAVQSALTGHLVLSTLHTNSAAATFARLLDMGVEDYLIASAVIGVAAQRLVRKICDQCSEEHGADPGILERLGLPAGTRLHRGRGCRACMGTGHRGRTVVCELLEVNEAVRHAVLEGGDADVIERTARERAGMRTLWDHAVEKVRLGETTYEEILESIQS